jgi:3'-phosphoadenosine 5'-phosphosulfate (PAPS) 3'-phosphatase
LVTLRSSLLDWLNRLRSFEISSKASSLKICMVAEGAVDLYPRLRPTCFWDAAAGQSIVERSGVYESFIGLSDLLRQPISDFESKLYRSR